MNKRQVSYSANKQVSPTIAQREDISSRCSNLYDSVPANGVTEQIDSAGIQHEGMYANTQEAHKTNKRIKCKQTTIMWVVAMMFALLVIAILATVIVMELNNQKEAAKEQTEAIKELKEEIKKVKAIMAEHEEAIKAQKKTIEELSQRPDHNRPLENITKQVEQIKTGFVRLDDGWITPLNGFQYKYLNSSGIASWTNSRSICQSNGGDLASYGMRSIAIRRIVFEAFSIGTNVWVGLNDRSSEGTWRWDTTLSRYGWIPGSDEINLFSLTPSSSYDCAYISYTSLFAYGTYCSYLRRILCEKRYP